MNNVSYDTIKVQFARSTLDAKREVAESSSERILELKAQRQELRKTIEDSEEEVTDLQIEMIGEKGEDLHELSEDAERVTARLQRDQAKLEVVGDRQKEQFDTVLEQEAATDDAYQLVVEIDDRIFEAMRFA
jgi:hypothetical protein